jgi:hypothetical protein
MGFWKRLASLFSGGGQAREQDVDYVYLRCQACGEPLLLRVDLRNDLSPEWEDTSEGGSDEPDRYYTRKVVIGRGRCFRPVEVELTYDRARRRQEARVKGGTLLSAEEYAQALSEWEKASHA